MPTSKKDEFRELLDIPKSYSNAEVTRTVLKTIQKNLDEFFEDLTITPIHKKKAVGIQLRLISSLLNQKNVNKTTSILMNLFQNNQLKQTSKKLQLIGQKKKQFRQKALIII
ncbi:hypothetical protein [Holzapfeliella floricola]|uniref:hypothetical protein n=1 Tax=Holzapfeliella floricola TaxID=679249 RepID=UPI0007837161|nr:hypothetical protein [Holzapfeliella floricola]